MSSFGGILIIGDFFYEFFFLSTLYFKKIVGYILTYPGKYAFRLKLKEM